MPTGLRPGNTVISTVCGKKTDTRLRKAAKRISRGAAVTDTAAPAFRVLIGKGGD